MDSANDYESDPENPSDQRAALLQLAHELDEYLCVEHVGVIDTGRGPAVEVLLSAWMDAWRGGPARHVRDEEFGIEDVSRQGGHVVARICT